MKSNVKAIVATYLKYFKNEINSLNQLVTFVNESTKEDKDIFSSTNTVGHITASGFIYAKKERMILLLEHKKLGKLLQPGGHVEDVDNTIVETAIREIYEETGLNNLELVNISSNTDIPFDINTHFIPENSKKNMVAHYHHDFRYLFTIEKISDIKIDITESNSYKWIRVSDLQENDNFRRIIEKINHILNSDLKIQRYYNKIISDFNINLKNYNSIVVSHIIPDCKEYLEALNSICPILKIIPKPNSIDSETMNQIKDEYDFMPITREEINSNVELQEIIKNSEKDIIIFDIGGYFSQFIMKHKSISRKIKFIIEDTENGYQKYENINSNIKILSVARSVLKENEDYLVGESIVFSADAMLRNVGKVLEYMNCGILGYGKIGSSIGKHLLQMGVKPSVYDCNSIKQIEAFNRMCDINNKEDILAKSDVLFLATGNHSLNIHDFRKLKNGSYIFSVTSSDDEIDTSYLETEYEIQEVKPHIFKYSNNNNFFYLVRKGNAVNFLHNAVMDNFIHLVRSEMIVSAQLLLENKNLVEINNILELDYYTKQKIGNIWLNIFKEGRF